MQNLSKFLAECLENAYLFIFVLEIAFIFIKANDVDFNQIENKVKFKRRTDLIYHNP